MNDTFQWFKSSYSGNGASCVECAHLPDGGMAVRDTKNRSWPHAAVHSPQSGKRS